MSRWRQFVSGALAGLLLAFVGVLLAPHAEPRSTANSTTTTTTRELSPAAPYWLDPHETLLGPVVVIPERLRVDGTEAIFTFRVEAITPARSGFVFEEDLGPPVGPQTFVLETASGEIMADSPRVGSTEVRFQVDEGFSPDEVTGVRIDRYWLRIPYTSDVDVPAVRGASVTLDEDLAFSVNAIVEQLESVLINIDIIRPPNDFVASPNLQVWVTGRGPGWRSTVRGSGIGTGWNSGIQLIHEGSDVGDVLLLRVDYPQWVPYDSSARLDLGGLIRG